ncbi:TonB-dependent receptor [Hymenobacter aerilatus]|uniref:TonB-dependent receptor n=1 Tax=Hymenobacter aerilatus TaxID=2932251 RepID=A0A8T9T1S8_9BACT|nr:outer membrane beta-barrel protein [Hymenobacter aerilatus]UOR07134.1 TonB-dependent receptor [Hymenobacter aerilatus]
MRHYVGRLLVKRFLASLFVLGWVASVPQVHAQTAPTLMGLVRDASGQPLEYATVTLHRAADSVAVKTEFCDAQGRFALPAALAGNYLISAALVGYNRVWSEPVTAIGQSQTLSPLVLQASAAATLHEVKVEARRPLYEREADRTIVNVEGSTLSAGATSLDVLGRAPGVTVDGADNLSLRGRQGLLVLIDGKRVPLSGTELADYLRALPAEQLASIELLSNPPAKFDAQGGAGIIAIRLKKDQRLGTNGTANISYGRGRYGKFTTGLALNHRRKNLNVFGNYTYTDRRNFLDLDFYRQFTSNDNAWLGSSEQFNRTTSHLQSHSWKAGLDYNLSDRTLLGVSVSGLLSEAPSFGDNQTFIYGETSDSRYRLTGQYRSTTDQMVQRPNLAGNLNLRHVFADSTNAPELTADLDVARYTTDRLLALTTVYELPDAPTSVLHGDQQNYVTIQSAKVDYSRLLPYRTRLETGAKVTYISSDNDAVFTNTVEEQTTLDTEKTNRFRYNENVNAAYISLQRATARTTTQLGLRAEQTNTLSRQSVGNERYEWHYFQLFPNLSVKRTLSEQHALALSLSRRLDRPSYGQLNPLRVYFDATSYQSGNPALRPQTSYDLELTHTFHEKYTSTLGYARTSNLIQNVVQPAPEGGRTVVNQFTNLGKLHFFSLTLTAPVEISRSWTMYNNLVLFYGRYLGSLAGTALDRGRPAFTFNTNQSFSFGRGWSADVTGLYQSREVAAFEVVRRRGQVTAGVQKSLWDKQATLRLNVSDVFYTTPIRSTSTYDNFRETFYNRFDSRVATLAFTYRFGGSKVTAARKRTVGADAELRRTGGF